MAPATGYGALSPSYGYYKPPQVSRIGTGNRSLALAMSGRPTQANPYGLLGSGANAYRTLNPPMPTPGKTVVPADTGPGATAATAPVIPNPAAPSTTPPAPTAPTPPAYDVNLEPVVQQVGSLADMTDEQAQAAALSQKQGALLNYGDANLVTKLLGDPTLAAAAAGNPTSTLAQLAQERGRNTTALTEGLNKANLLYSGYRVNQEQQAAEDYQNELAQAAANVGGALSGIDQNLTGALNQSRAQRVQAMLDAFNRNPATPGAAGGVAGGLPGADVGQIPGGTAAGDTTTPPSTIADLNNAVTVPPPNLGTGDMGSRQSGNPSNPFPQTVGLAPNAAFAALNPRTRLALAMAGRGGGGGRALLA